MLAPLGDRVLIEVPEEPEEKTTASGIIISGEDKVEKVLKGTVIGVGPQVKEDIKLGDKILFSKYGYEEVEDTDRKTYFVTHISNVMAVIHD